MRKEKVIWDGTIYDFSDMAKELMEDLQEEYPDKPQEWWEDYAREVHNDYLYDEIVNLDIKTEGCIVAIANLGLWNGHVCGIKVLDKNVNSIFKAGVVQGDIKYYSDGYNIRANDHHHDGINYYTFREMREGRDVDTLVEKFLTGTVKPSTVKYYTKPIVHYVNNVYGW